MSAKPPDAAMTGMICAALRRKYEDRQRFCFLEEVGNATGSYNAGWADAFVFHLWPSDGLQFWGFEVKASRSDWKRELANPKKSERISRYCDRWIVVAAKGIVKRYELPPAWGLWEYDSEKDQFNYVVKGAESPRAKYIPRRFFAALLRRTQDTLPSVEYLARFTDEARRRAGREWAQKMTEHDNRNERLRRELERSEAERASLVKAIGAEGYYWNEWRGTLERRASA